MRRLQPKDAEILRQFFYSHTPDTIQQRYGYMLKDMSVARASQLVGIDQDKDLALGIFEMKNGEEILHAIGRYCLDPGGTSAEMAFVVRETKRRLGMAGALLKAMLATGKERGLQTLWAQVLYDNAAMLGLLQRHGAVRMPSTEPGTLQLKIDLSAKPAHRPLD